MSVKPPRRDVHLADPRRRSGTIDRDFVSGAVHAELTVSGPGSSDGTVSLSYAGWAPQAVATLVGTLGGRSIAATMDAP